MTERFDLVEVADGAVLDTIVFTDADVTYQTGEAQTLVESRMRLIPDREAMVLSLDGWSNGYVQILRAKNES